MRQFSTRVFMFATAAVMLASVAGAQGPDAALQAKLDSRVQTARLWAADPTVVAAVKALNANLPAEYAAMTDEKWTELSVLDPFVRAFTKNDVATFLKGKKGDDVSEAFVSAANGTKVAFLAKTTSWSHKGKAKHETPMTGKVWQGPIETDKSSGVQQIQVAVPVLDGGKPIGSLVVGYAISKLR
jgi:aconitase B